MVADEFSKALAFPPLPQHFRNVPRSPCDQTATKSHSGVLVMFEAPYSPGNRGLWLKVKCQNREEFVVVGWTDPEGPRPWLGAVSRRAMGGKTRRARSPARHAGVPECFPTPDPVRSGDRCIATACRHSTADV